MKFEDKNANHVKDAGDGGLALWEIRAYVDSNGDGVLQATETSFTSTLTDASGNYSFTLNPGAYVICEKLQTGWTQSFPTGNTKCLADPTLGPAGYALTVTSNSSDTGNVFFNFQNGPQDRLNFPAKNSSHLKDAGDGG